LDIDEAKDTSIAVYPGWTQTIYLPRDSMHRVTSKNNINRKSTLCG